MNPVPQNNTINNVSFMFTVACFIQSSTMLTAFVTTITGHDTWIVTAIASILSIPLMLVILALVKRFPGKGLFEINDFAFGKIGGTMVSIVYMFFFFLLTSLNLRDASNFINQTVMNNTPMMALSICFMGLVAYATYKGLNVIGKYAAAFVILSFFFIGISMLTTMLNADAGNFLPMLRLPVVKYIQGTHVLMTIPFGELVCLLVIAPYIARNGKSLGKELCWGFFMGVITFLAVVVRDTSVLGNTMRYFALPSFQTLKLAKFTDTLGHLEIIFAIILLVLLYFRIAILYFCYLVMLSKILRFQNYNYLIIPTSCVILVYSFIIFSSFQMHMDYGNRVIPFLWIIPELILPVITLVVILIRRKKEKAPDTQNAPEVNDAVT